MDIGRGRRREHPMDTSKGVTWPSVITGVAQLPVVHAHTQGDPKVSSDLWSHPLIMVLLIRKKRGGKNGACVEHTSDLDRFRTGPLPVTWLCHFGQKSPLWRIWRNFRLRITYFRTGNMTDVTSGKVASGHAQWSDPHRSSANMVLSVPIYYSHIT